MTQDTPQPLDSAARQAEIFRLQHELRSLLWKIDEAVRDWADQLMKEALSVHALEAPTAELVSLMDVYAAHVNANRAQWSGGPHERNIVEEITRTILADRMHALTLAFKANLIRRATK